MTREQAIAFVTRLNALEPYVPPLLFNAVANSEVVRLAVAVANGQLGEQASPLNGGNNERAGQSQST